MWVKLQDNSTVQLVQANYKPNAPFATTIDHIAGTDLSVIHQLGMQNQEWIIGGYVSGVGSTDTPATFDWTKIVAVSIDNTTWRAATPLNLQWIRHLSQLHQYELTLSVSPLRYGTTHTATAIWGWNTITVPAATGSGLIRVSYQGPTRYWPLQSSLTSVDNVGVTFARTVSEVYKGIAYGIGIPIFDGGLIVDAANVVYATIAGSSLVMRIKNYHTGGGTTQYLWQNANNSCSLDITTGVVSWTDGTTTITVTLPSRTNFLAGDTLDIVALDDTTETLVVNQSGVTNGSVTNTGTLSVLAWGTLYIGSNAGTSGQLYAAVSHIVIYPYVLTAAEYGALHLTIAPLAWTGMSIAYRSSGTISINSSGRLVDAYGADITACFGGVLPVGVSTLAMTNGLSARWLVSVDDTWRV